MLVLTRKVGEKVHIGENIVITVTAVEGNKVRLGISAPACVDVWRSELRERRPTLAGPCSPFVLVAEEAAPAPRRLTPLSPRRGRRPPKTRQAGHRWT